MYFPLLEQLSGEKLIGVLVTMGHSTTLSTCADKLAPLFKRKFHSDPDSLSEGLLQEIKKSKDLFI